MLADGNRQGGCARPAEVLTEAGPAGELMASQEVGICTTALSVSSKTERIDTVFDVERSEGKRVTALLE